MGFRDNEPFLQFGGKIDPLSEIRNAGIVTNGSVFWVKIKADTDYTTFKDQVGADVIVNTIQDGINKTRNDKNDFVMVVPQNSGSVFSQTTTVNMNKDRVHLIGVGYTQSQRGYAVTLEGFGTAGTASISNGLLNMTGGDGCEVAGFRFLGTAGTSTGGTVGNGGTGGLITCGTGLKDLHMHHFRLDITGAQFDSGTPTGLLDCGSASTGLFFTDFVISEGTRTALVNSPIALGFNGQDVVFKDGQIIMHAIVTGNTHAAAKGGTITGVYVTFDNVDFINTNSGTLNASAVGGTLPSGAVGLIKSCPAIYVTQTGTSTQLFVAPTSGTATVVKNSFIGIGTAALINA